MLHSVSCLIESLFSSPSYRVVAAVVIVVGFVLLLQQDQAKAKRIKSVRIIKAARTVAAVARL
jgi:hypothetical protein